MGDICKYKQIKLNFSQLILSQTQNLIYRRSSTVNVVTSEICSSGMYFLTVHPVLSLDVFETLRGCRGSRGMDNIIRFCPLAEISRFF